MRSFYDILEVDKSAGAEEIKRAYFEYLRRIHPDKAAIAGIGEESVTFATYLWRTLKDPIKRREYDLWLREQQLRQTKGAVAEYIEIADGDVNAVEEPCRCGDWYKITSEEVQKVVDVGFFECASCSLCLKVYKIGK